MTDGATDIMSGQFQKLFSGRIESSDPKIMVDHEDGNTHRGQKILEVAVSGAQLGIAALQLFINSGEFLVGRLKLFFGGSQLLVGRLYLFVCAPSFFVGSAKLLGIGLVVFGKITQI